MLRRGVVFASAFLGALVGMTLLVLGLVATESVIFPLATGVAALLAALSAGWTATWLARDGTRTQLLPVVGAAEGIALVIVLTGLVMPSLRASLDGPVGGIGVAVSLALAVGATWAAWHFRRPAQATANDARLTLVLLGVALVAIIGVLGLASALGLAGA